MSLGATEASVVESTGTIVVLVLKGTGGAPRVMVGVLVVRRGPWTLGPLISHEADEGRAHESCSKRLECPSARPQSALSSSLGLLTVREIRCIASRNCDSLA